MSIDIRKKNDFFKKTIQYTTKSSDFLSVLNGLNYHKRRQLVQLRLIVCDRWGNAVTIYYMGCNVDIWVRGCKSSFY